MSEGEPAPPVSLFPLYCCLPIRPLSSIWMPRAVYPSTLSTDTVLIFLVSGQTTWRVLVSCALRKPPSSPRRIVSSYDASVRGIVKCFTRLDARINRESGTR